MITMHPTDLKIAQYTNNCTADLTVDRLTLCIFDCTVCMEMYYAQGGAKNACLTGNGGKLASL